MVTDCIFGICRKIQKDFDDFLKKRKMMKAAMSRSTSESAVSVSA